MYFGDAAGIQALARQQVDVRQILDVRNGGKGAGCCQVMRHEGCPDFRPDFKGIRPDGRPEPRQDVTGRYGHPGDGGFDDAVAQPAPAGVGGSHDAAGPVGHQHRQAVCRHDGTYHARLAREAGIGIGRDIRCVCAGFLHADAVNLVQPEWFGRQAGPQAGPVFGDGSRIVAHMLAQVQAGIGCQADTTVAGRDQGADAGRSRPVGSECLHGVTPACK